MILIVLMYYTKIFQNIQVIPKFLIIVNRKNCSLLFKSQRELHRVNQHLNNNLVRLKIVVD